MEDDFRFQVEWQLGSPLTQREWAFLQRQAPNARYHRESWPASTREDLPPLVEWAVQQIHEGRAAFGDARRRHGAPPKMEPPGQPLDGSNPGRARLQALAQVLHAQAQYEQDVDWFRFVRLRSGSGGQVYQLLAPDQVDAWIESHRESPSEWLEVPVDRSDLEVTADGSIFGLAGRFRVPPEHDYVRVEGRLDELLRRRYLAYTPPGKSHAEPMATTAGGALEHLRSVAFRLAETYPWLEEQATLFLLTNYIPVLDPVVVADQGSLYPAVSRVTLTTDPAVAPRDLANTFAEVRKPIIGQRHRDLSPKHLHLAVFTAIRRSPSLLALQTASERPPVLSQGSWEELMNDWNELWEEEHPDWRYEDTRRFATEALRARHRLLGEK